MTLCVIFFAGFLGSYFFNWPIDTSGTSGDIAKSNRFSRKAVNIEMSNMQELLANDEEFKNNLVVAYTVMQVRANQFDALVDMSVEVADDKKEFETILADMKAAKPMIKNVCASMSSAGDDLNAALGGENVSDLTQNTNNAALAYTTLQKQNELADRFIEAADNYLKNSEADDRFKLVRDEWVEYQLMTATLNNDDKAAEKLTKSGYLLSSDRALTSLSSFDGPTGCILDVVTAEKLLGLVNKSLFSEVNVPEFLKAYGGAGIAHAFDGVGVAHAFDGVGVAHAFDELEGKKLNEIDPGTFINAVPGTYLAGLSNKDGIANAFSGVTMTAGHTINQGRLASETTTGVTIMNLNPADYLHEVINPTIASMSLNGQSVANGRAGVQIR